MSGEDRTAEMHLVVELRELVDIGKEARDGDPCGLLMMTHRRVPRLVGHEYDRVPEIGIGQFGTGDEQESRHAFHVVSAGTAKANSAKSAQNSRFIRIFRSEYQ